MGKRDSKETSQEVVAIAQERAGRGDGDWM